MPSMKRINIDLIKVVLPDILKDLDVRFTPFSTPKALPPGYRGVANIEFPNLPEFQKKNPDYFLNNQSPEITLEVYLTKEEVDARKRILIMKDPEIALDPRVRTDDREDSIGGQYHQVQMKITDPPIAVG